MARAHWDDDFPDVNIWTDYVATRWYRAPELILTHKISYSTAIDIWSVGCIFAEMLGKGVPLFPGKDAYTQLTLMINLLGSPSPEALEKVQSDMARKHFENLPKSNPPPLSERFPGVEPVALDLLAKLLDWDPHERITAYEALSHPYFYECYEPGEGPDNEPTAPPVDKSEFLFERTHQTPETMRRLFLEEIALYHPEVAKVLEAADDLAKEAMEQVKQGEQMGPLPPLSRLALGMPLSRSESDTYEVLSQSEAFARSMESMEKGIAQRKTTSMPKNKMQRFTEGYQLSRGLRGVGGGVSGSVGGGGGGGSGSGRNGSNGGRSAFVAARIGQSNEAPGALDMRTTADIMREQAIRVESPNVALLSPLGPPLPRRPVQALNAQDALGPMMETPVFPMHQQAHAHADTPLPSPPHNLSTPLHNRFLRPPPSSYERAPLPSLLSREPRSLPDWTAFPLPQQHAQRRLPGEREPRSLPGFPAYPPPLSANMPAAASSSPALVTASAPVSASDAASAVAAAQARTSRMSLAVELDPPPASEVPFSAFTAMELLDNSASQPFSDGMGAPWPPIPSSVPPPPGAVAYDTLNGELFPASQGGRGGYGVQPPSYHPAT